LTALVGENDAGKTAVIDALRFALGTRDQQWYSLEDRDFREGDTRREIRVVCRFASLSGADQRALVEFLTYGEGEKEPPVLYVNWTAKDLGEGHKRRPYREVTAHSGKSGDGPAIPAEVRELLRATYLRPLRDAEAALSAGRGSRLSQVLQYTEQVKNSGVPYNPKGTVDPYKLNVLGIGDFANALLEKQSGISDARKKVDGHLEKLSLASEAMASSIKVGGSTAADEVRLRQLLEKLDLMVGGKGKLGKLGLGSDNLLFIACELLLLAQQGEGNKLLLIEEPEAHLHPQRQLRVMRYMQDQAEQMGIQIVVTTHSPNLASVIKLDNMVMIQNARAFPLGQHQTQMDCSDYRFLERFLDVTKANLFFARGVVIVEGDAENILLPTLASLLGRDFAEHGVSVVNVGGVGLRRYARIFQRKDVEKDGQLDIPVACVADLDVMPDCAPSILGKVTPGGEWPATHNRRWRAKRDLDGEEALAAHRCGILAKASDQCVRTFVSDEWTLEYDLALGPRDEGDHFSGGLAEDVFVAASLADRDDDINQKKTTGHEVEEEAITEFAEIKAKAVGQSNCAPEELLASFIYARFARDGVSKAVAAQYLAERLRAKHKDGKLTAGDLRKRLPRYLVQAIDYASRSAEPVPLAEVMTSG
jgi:putative ATP-dependent endonuclease of OLD family